MSRCDEVPTAEKWTTMMKEADPETALKLLQQSNECLDISGSQMWNPLIRIARDILKEREIQSEPDGSI
jgi:hypothetical protein